MTGDTICEHVQGASEGALLWLDEPRTCDSPLLMIPRRYPNTTPNTASVRNRTLYFALPSISSVQQSTAQRESTLGGVGVSLSRLRGMSEGADQQLEFLRRQCCAEMKPLVLIAAHLLQQCELGSRFNALSDHFEIQTVSEGDHGAYDGGIRRAAGHLLHKRAVDLELVDREAPQITHAGIPGPEIIH